MKSLLIGLGANRMMLFGVTISVLYSTALAVAQFPPPPPPPPPPPAPFFISGTVTNLATGAGESGVTVTCGTGSTTTDSSGRYTIVHQVQGTATCTLSASKSGHYIKPDPQNITMTGGGSIQKDFILLKEKYLNGVVTQGGQGLSGVTMACSGASSGSATTDSTGRYHLVGLNGGSITVTPSKPGYVFTPASRTVSLSGSGLALDAFSASPAYSIAGRVTERGNGVGTVTIRYDGPVDGTVSTGSDGRYTISNVPAGSYVITPSKSNYAFGPRSSSASVSNGNVTGKDFICSPVRRMSGTVRYNGQGLADVQVTYYSAGMPSGVVRTNSRGEYFVNDAMDGQYQVWAQKSGYTFSPTRITTTLDGADQSGMDFSGTRN